MDENLKEEFVRARARDLFVGMARDGDPVADAVLAFARAEAFFDEQQRRAALLPR